MKICDFDKCTGCGECTNVCAKNAIKMQEGKNDFIYPVVDNSLCINCGQCVKKCPINNNPKINNVLNVYAAWNKNSKIRDESTSGGLFYLLGKRIIENGGVVVGVAWDKNWNTEHKCVTNLDDLKCLMGSKYLQSNTGNIYKTVKELLDNNKKVLFSGTPCQIHAMKLYLGKDYDNLLLVDLVCHGIPPANMFQKHIGEVTSSQNTQIKKISLRYKDLGWSYSSVLIKYANKEYKELTCDDAYFNLFNFNYSLRNSCHNCQYTNTQRCSDITLSDFWGFDPQNWKMRNYDKGVSCVIVNTVKGEKIIQDISKYTVIEKAKLEKAIMGNKCLDMAFDAPKDVNWFWDDYKNGMSISELKNKYIKEPFKLPRYAKIKSFVAKYGWLLKRLNPKFCVNTEKRYKNK